MNKEKIQINKNITKKPPQERITSFLLDDHEYKNAINPNSKQITKVITRETLAMVNKINNPAPIPGLAPILFFY
jgi:hypothetical protein